MDKVPDKLQPPTFDRTIVERISITPVTQPPEEEPEDEDLARQEQNLLDGKSYLTETTYGQPTDPAFWAEHQRQIKIVGATAEYFKNKAIAEGKSPEEVEAAVQAGIQTGALYVGYSTVTQRPSASFHSPIPERAHRWINKPLRDISSLAGDREI
ncbi:hypothetical protein IQ250_02855 [Pseudanabaenaceae cyanobacterium LEGE 13415]|nr:hypothetical protein [Pseudanabaenaceae cyanobacterium LEGE 13415]